MLFYRGVIRAGTMERKGVPAPSKHNREQHDK